MASVLKVNTLTGVTTAGSIAVTGEGNSTTTSLQQGLSKLFTKFQGDDASVNDSFNVSSVDDDATGYNGVNFSNNMAAIHYATHSTTAHNYGASNNGWSSAVASSDGEAGMTTSSVQVSHGNSGGSNADPTAVHVTIDGDLA
tara:strand:+ start:96 stop:521 length:426 start_codon:yes stop_codon:yes gene_type:complete